MPTISSNDARELGLLPKKGNKYHARKTEYNGVIYDSKAEATRAAELDALRAAGDVAWWLRQHTFHLTAGVTYRADFIVAYVGKWDVHAEDVKGGQRDRRFEVIKQLWKKHGPFSIHILKRSGNGWNREVITPGRKDSNV